MIENPIQLVKALKGSAISILFAMAIAKQNVGAEWLARITGYSDKPVQDGLLLLEEYELVVRIDRCHWGLTGRAHRLPLMDNSPLQLFGDNDQDVTRNNSESSLATAATTTIEGSKRKKGKAVEEDKSTRNNSESIDLLHAGGIGEPMAAKLAALDWVTPAYIKAHLQKGIENQVEIGLVIHRMLYHDPAPLSWEEIERKERRRLAELFSR
jgi:tRNA U34 5-carboxymethylaminomethyl modifying enzyme MnmG/GidA